MKKVLWVIVAVAGAQNCSDPNVCFYSHPDTFGFEALVCTPPDVTLEETLEEGCFCGSGTCACLDTGCACTECDDCSSCWPTDEGYDCSAENACFYGHPDDVGVEAAVCDCVDETGCACYDCTDCSLDHCGTITVISAPTAEPSLEPTTSAPTIAPPAPAPTNASTVPPTLLPTIVLDSSSKKSSETVSTTTLAIIVVGSAAAAVLIGVAACVVLRRRGREPTAAYYYPDEAACAAVLGARSYYEVLEVPAKADTATIRKQYIRVSVKVHPDRNRSPDATRAFQRVAEAYEVLRDEDRRREYDARETPIEFSFEDALRVFRAAVRAAEVAATAATRSDDVLGVAAMLLRESDLGDAARLVAGASAAYALLPDTWKDAIQKRITPENTVKFVGTVAVVAGALAAATRAGKNSRS
ncbi:hypothetical protein CTAYLR_008213 [Chrysophaeum taylorii]|uniref:J domain-containing protein n=1 Tax=Chrysophaeum taylorii TaxID=2483200 RepID=A0AAD7UBX5_9STRA|nr:hypothetical protein CTAYLR_008213 [Chrysophaeum taylorii]